jgi:hypothetical protein
MRIVESDKPIFLIEIEERHKPGSVADIASFMEGRGYRSYFVHGDRVRPIAEFDIARHQDASLIGEGDRAGYKDYINNFIFVPPHVNAPESIPSPWQALFVSLGRMMTGRSG